MEVTYKNKLIDLKYIIDKDYESIRDFLRYNGVNKFDENDIDALKSISSKIINTFGFNVSYNVDRLDKEFDLIKIGNKKIVNVELKLSEKDLEQCEDNYNILSKYYNGWEIEVFCFENKRNILYRYDSEFRVLVKVKIEELNNKLNEIDDPITMSVNFDVTSVYSSPNYYLENNYSLSKSQERIKRKILELSEDEDCILITGRAGTGKTLLALDLYLYYKNLGEKVCYIAPFKINSLVNDELLKNVKMRTAKWFLVTPDDSDIIIVDEAQRLDRNSFLKLKKHANKRILFFGDINQRLEYESYFMELYKKRNYTCLNLNQVIRSDDTFDIYAKKVLNISTNGIKNKKVDSSKINILMEYERLPELSDYVFIEPAKSKYYITCKDKCENLFCQKIGYKCANFKSAYDIIGQEYSKVAMAICDGYYVKEKEIKCRSGLCYANLQNQLYTIMTRATNELLIIVDNIEMYNYLYSKKETL